MFEPKKCRGCGKVIGGTYIGSFVGMPSMSLEPHNEADCLSWKVGEWTRIGEEQRQRAVAAESKLHSCEATMQRDRVESQLALDKWAADFKAQASRLDALTTERNELRAKYNADITRERDRGDELAERLDAAETALQGARYVLAAICKESVDGTVHIRAYTFDTLSLNASIELDDAIDGGIRCRIVEKHESE